MAGIAAAHNSCFALLAAAIPTRNPPATVAWPCLSDQPTFKQDVPHTVDIDSTIDLCGGINCPLVLKTTDSDGTRQRLVAKSGQDDLRQDAVMQQFFNLVNALLGSSAASRQRRLGIRTYR